MPTTTTAISRASTLRVWPAFQGSIGRLVAQTARDRREKKRRTLRLTRIPAAPHAGPPQQPLGVNSVPLLSLPIVQLRRSCTSLLSSYPTVLHHVQLLVKSWVLAAFPSHGGQLHARCRKHSRSPNSPHTTPQIAPSRPATSTFQATPTACVHLPSSLPAGSCQLPRGTPGKVKIVKCMDH